jgi:hypothetical protein
MPRKRHKAEEIVTKLFSSARVFNRTVLCLRSLDALRRTRNLLAPGSVRDGFGVAGEIQNV